MSACSRHVAVSSQHVAISSSQQPAGGSRGFPRDVSPPVQGSPQARLAATTRLLELHPEIQRGPPDLLLPLLRLRLLPGPIHAELLCLMLQCQQGSRAKQIRPGAGPVDESMARAQAETSQCPEGGYLSWAYSPVGGDPGGKESPVGRKGDYGAVLRARGNRAALDHDHIGGCPRIGLLRGAALRAARGFGTRALGASGAKGLDLLLQGLRWGRRKGRAGSETASLGQGFRGRPEL